MARFLSVPKPSILRHTVRRNVGNVVNVVNVVLGASPEQNEAPRTEGRSRRMTFTGAVGALCMFPLRGLIRACVALRIHPNVLTFVGVVINVASAWALGAGRLLLAGVIMIVANIFDFIDGKVAVQLHLQSRFGAFWDSTLDRSSDLALLVGLIYFYAKLGRTDYVLVAAVTLIFSIMTSYARARAESLVERCKVGFMERPERIVLFMIGAFTNRMAAVLWVILVLSILAVANRIYYTYLALNGKAMPPRAGVKGFFWRAFFWTDERTTIPYDLWVIAILAFVWLTPPDWLRDPMAHGPGLAGWIAARVRN